MTNKQRETLSNIKAAGSMLFISSPFLILGVAIMMDAVERSHYKKQIIIYCDNTATICDVNRVVINNTTVYFETTNDIKMEVPIAAVQVVDLKEGLEITAEDIAMLTMGEDVKINYLYDPEEHEIGNQAFSFK